MKTCVHVTTQKEWDAVIFVLREDYYNNFTTYKDICIDLSDGCYCNKEYYKKQGYKIISFKEWAKNNNKTTVNKRRRAISI